MAQFRDRVWWKKELKRMLKSQEPEDLHLDYKDKRSLLPRGRGGGGIDRQKRAEDVSKDVSSFLNSDGGVLIYGVPETSDSDTTGGAPIPTDSADSNRIGFDRGEIDKEAIENLITSNIQPKPGPELFQIAEVEYGDRVVFVVQVAIGLGDVWQATDKRYYKRFHYKAEAMEHYEINMIRNRYVEPDLKLVFGFGDYWSKTKWIRDMDEDDDLHIGLQNETHSAVESAFVELGVLDSQRFGRASAARSESEEKALNPFQHVGVRSIRNDWGEFRVDWYNLAWPVDGMYRPIFKKLEPDGISKFRFVAQGRNIARLLWRIQAPGMPPKTGRAMVIVDDWDLEIKIEEENGDFEISGEA